MQPFIRHKVLKVIILNIILSMSAIMAFTANAAAFAPGCYENNQPVSCSVSAQVDTNGQALNTTTNCYNLLTGPVATGQGNWQPVSCSDLTTAVAAGAGCYTSGLAINKVACTVPSGAQDNQNNPIDVNANCYIVNSAENPTTFLKVDCSSIKTATNYCGGPGQAVETAINFGCKQQGNPIIDLIFAIIRFLSLGVGIVVIGSIVVAGIQYTTSRGDPQATSRALGRIRGAVGALLIFIFAYAILNYVIPYGFFFK